MRNRRTRCSGGARLGLVVLVAVSSGCARFGFSGPVADAAASDQRPRLDGGRSDTGGSDPDAGPDALAADLGADLFAVPEAGCPAGLSQCGSECVALGSPCVSTLAGSGQAGLTDGTGAAAEFFAPTGVAVDNSGRVYVADRANHCIRKISGSGVVATIAGDGTPGYQDGQAASARFHSPEALAVGPAGTVYVADTGNHRIRAISAGTVSTIAGGQPGFIDGLAPMAQFLSPAGLAVDSAGVVYVADMGNHRVRTVDPQKLIVTTVAGDGQSGHVDDKASAARFNLPADVDLKEPSPGSLVVYVADMGNSRIRIIADGKVSTLGGFVLNPEGLAVRGSSVLVAETGNYRIVEIDASGGTTVLAGRSGSPGWVDGPAASALFGEPTGIAVGQGHTIYIADKTNNRIRLYAR